MAARKNGSAKSFADYSPKLNMSEAERAADFIDWCARMFPKRAVPYIWIVKVGNAKKHPPKEGSKEVELFRKSKMARVRKVLFERYERHVVPIPGKGLRGTVGSEDVAETDQESKAKRVLSAIDGLDRSRSLIKRADLKGATKVRYDKLGDAHKQLMSANIRGLLERPKEPEENK